MVLKFRRYLPELTRETAILSGILAVTAVVYLRTLENAFVLDDVVQIVKNPDLPDWSFLWKAFTRNEFWYSDAAFVHGGPGARRDSDAADSSEDELCRCGQARGSRRL